jgi:FixJ family two-component response regulator
VCALARRRIPNSSPSLKTGPNRYFTADYNNGHDFLQDTPFVDCLVVDYYMPDFNGLDLVSELRKRTYSAPVIILTGMSNEIPGERVAELEVKHVVEKSSGYHALLRAVQDAARASPGMTE